MARTGALTAGRRREWAWLLALAACALGVRLAFVTVFPTRPFADFRNLVRFAQAYAEDGLARGFSGWELWSPGLPLALSLVLRVVPGPPAEVARYATAVVTGLSALVPFLVWRGVVSLQARILASLLLALWPGHVFVSGVVSQDNWVLLPSVFVAALAVRAMIWGGSSHPLAAAIGWGAAGAIRQEMLVVLLPLALAAAGLTWPPRSGMRRRMALFGVAAAALLLALAGLRWAGSGRFRLGTEHQGLAVLGACAPGAGSAYWTFGQTYFAAFAPELVEDWEEMKRRAASFALREIARRPRFHLVRMVAAGTNSLLQADASGLFTSIASEVALPAPYLARGQGFAAAARRPLMAGTVVLLAATLAALALAARRRHRPVLVIGAAMALKVLLHAVTVAQYRFFAVVIAFALLVIALTVEDLRDHWPGWRPVGGAVLAGAAGAALLVAVAARTEAWVVRNEEQLTYRFVLKDPRRDARLRCTVREGLLTLLYTPRDAALRLRSVDPPPGERAAAECELEARRPTDSLVFEFSDGFPAGGLPGRIVQVVTLDGREVARHDLAAQPGSDWIAVPLGMVQPGAPRRLTLSVVAVEPEPGASWGTAATTAFRLSNGQAAR